MSARPRGRCSFRSLGDGEIELLVEYGIERDRTSWLEEGERPTLLVTGASGFIGRYMVDLLVRLGYKVFATDLGPRPSYLAQERFKGVEYAPADLREEEAVDFLMKWVRPTVVFHIGAVFDFSASADLLKAVNVTGTERVCDAARSVGARRLVYWSTGSIYAPSDEPATESAAKQPADPYAQSKLEGERAAFAFHSPPEFEVYSLRPAMVTGILSRYGSGLVTRLMYEGYLVGPPQRRGMTTAVVNARDVATCGYLLAARRLALAASSSDDTAFNAAADPVDVDAMMRQLGRLVPRRHLVGLRTTLAEIISFGYQERIRLPDRLVRLIGAASGLVTGLLNHFRLAKLHPKIPPATVPYLTEPHPMANAKARELLGWIPDPIDADLEQTARYYEETGWTGFERRFSAEEESRVRLFEEVETLVQQLGSEETVFAGPGSASQAATEDETSYRCPRVTLPSLGLEVDERSLQILISAARSHIVDRASHRRLSELVAGTFPQLATHAVEDAALYLKYAYRRAFGSGGLPERGLFDLVRAVLRIDRDQMVSWLLVANVARLVEAVRRNGELLTRLSALLPEGRYGVLAETGFGDVALEYRKEGLPHELAFVREELDAIPGYLPLPRRVERLRKLRGLKLAVGAHFEDLVRLFASRPDRTVEPDGQDTFMGVLKWLVCSPPDVLDRISNKVTRSRWTQLFFEDADGHLMLGINTSDPVVFVPARRLEAFDLARKILSKEGFVAAFAEASAGAEKVFVYPVEEFRKLLSEAMSTGIVSRLFGR